MRVITGIYKGRHFEIPRTFKARPTTDFAKENLFNVLRAYVDFEDVRALDLFAGTGSITLELLSRGCISVTSVEKDRQHYAFIRSVIAAVKAENSTLLCADALRYAARSAEHFDLVFADPPYKLEEIPNLPDLVLSGNTLADDGIFVLEHGKQNDFSSHPCFLEHRAYGSVNFSFFRKLSQDSSADTK